MRFIFSIILVSLVFGFFVSILFVLGNTKIKEKVFYLVMSVVILMCMFGTVYFQSLVGI